MSASSNLNALQSLLGWAGSIGRRLAQSQYLILWFCVAYVGLMAPATPGFLAPENMVNVMSALLPLFLVALGQTFVLIAGGIDLSVTSILAVSSVAGAKIMSEQTGWLAGNSWAVPVAVLAMLGLGALVGFINGLSTTRLKMPSFIVTLTTMIIFSGIAIWSTHSKNIGALPHGFVVLGANPWFALLFVGSAGALAHLMLSRSMFGRWLYATGHNARASLVSGVPVQGTIIAAFVVSGLCAGGAAIIYTAQAETGSPVLGQRLLMDVIGATILGGTSLFGGRGKVLWTLCGVLFLKLVDNSLNLLNLSIFSITMIKGGVILFASLIDAARHRFSQTAA